MLRAVACSTSTTSSSERYRWAGSLRCLRIRRLPGRQPAGAQWFERRSGLHLIRCGLGFNRRHDQYHAVGNPESCARSCQLRHSRSTECSGRHHIVHVIRERRIGRRHGAIELECAGRSAMYRDRGRRRRWLGWNCGCDGNSAGFRNRRIRGGVLLKCQLPGGRTVTSSVVVTWGAPAPIVTLHAPDHAWTTTPIPLSWTSNAAPCSLTGGMLALSNLPASGSVTTTQATPGGVLYQN